RSVRADTALAAVVGASDGELTPAQAAAGVAVLTDTAPHAVLQSVIADIRGLVLDGFLHLPGYREEGPLCCRPGRTPRPRTRSTGPPGRRSWYACAPPWSAPHWCWCCTRCSSPPVPDRCGTRR